MDCNDFDENTWGRALLCPNRHGGDNQLWKIEDGELICQHEGARLKFLFTLHTQGFLTIKTFQIDAIVDWSNLGFILF